MSSVNNPARRQTEQGMMTAKIYVLNCSVYCHVSNIYVMEKSTLRGIQTDRTGVNCSMMDEACSPLGSFLN